MTIQKIEEQLSSTSSEQMINISLNRLLFIYKTIEELRQFFHNSDHYPTIEDVREFVGNKNQGMYSVINHIYVDIFNEIFPEGFDEDF